MKLNGQILGNSQKDRASSSIYQFISSTNLPFFAEIMVVPLPPKFKVPSVNLCDGSKAIRDFQNPYDTPWISQRNHVLSLPFNIKGKGKRTVLDNATGLNR